MSIPEDDSEPNKQDLQRLLADDGLDEFGRPVDLAEAQQQVMLGLYDIQFEAGVSDFSPELIALLKEVRVKFMDEFERRFPGYGKGRAVWR